MQIKIGKVPGRTQVLELQEGATIADAVRQANLDVTGHELRHNGTATENFNASIGDGAIILLTPRIKGNADIEYISASIEGDEYVIKAGTTVNELLRVAGFGCDEIEKDEVVAIETTIDSEAVYQAVNLNSRAVAFGKYWIVDKDEAIIPEPGVRETSECNCGCNNVNTDLLANGESITLTIGDVKIVVTKNR